nr:MAG TPA: hypothetical protein [Caudoviricetes sp.]
MCLLLAIPVVGIARIYDVYTKTRSYFLRDAP